MKTWKFGFHVEALTVIGHLSNMTVSVPFFPSSMSV